MNWKESERQLSWSIGEVSRNLTGGTEEKDVEVDTVYFKISYCLNTYMDGLSKIS